MSQIKWKKRYYGKKRPRLLILNAWKAFCLVSDGKLDLAAYDGEVLMICDIVEELWGILMTTKCEKKEVNPRVRRMKEELDKLAQEDRVIFINVPGLRYSNHDLIDQLAGHRWYNKDKPLWGKDEAVPDYDKGEHAASRLVSEGYNIDIIV